MLRIYLDIDGVLNGHECHPNGYCGTTKSCVATFNKMFNLAERMCLDVEIVISSAWRYVVHSVDMTAKGLENLLLTHGVNCAGMVVGVTRRDAFPTEMRMAQILDHLSDNKLTEKDVVVVIDDMDLKSQLTTKTSGFNFIRTDGNFGLTDDEFDEFVRIIYKYK